MTEFLVPTILLRLETDKPVRKTPYQVKGVFLSHLQDEPIVPFINGGYRQQYLYPRVQVKILNEQIHVFGIGEGVAPIRSMSNKLETMDFGNITFTVSKAHLEESEEHFRPANHLVRYRFITPWIALNEHNLVRYKSCYGEDRLNFLARLLSQNIIFIAKDLGMELSDDVLTYLELQSLYPTPMDEGKGGAFYGEFKTNFVLPNFLGLGNRITKGYGSVFTHFNASELTYQEQESSQANGSQPIVEALPIGWQAEAVSPAEVERRDRRERDVAAESPPPETPQVKKSIEPEEPNFNSEKFHRRSHL